MVEDVLRREIIERFLAIGFVPDDDLRGSIEQLRRLVAIQSEASELLAGAAAAERRMVEREALAGLVGTLDLPAMEQALREPAQAPVHPLVIVDDQDDDALPELRTMLGDLPASAHVSVVTRDPSRWEVHERTGRAPATAEPQPVAPRPKPERPWFAGG
jgi:hypothetical protein